MYLRPRIIPCLLLENGNLVKSKQFKDNTYLGDPINAVKIFNEEEADELCLLDISSHRNNKIDFELLEDVVSEAFMPLAYGGYISSLEDAKRLFRMGFEKVIFNTAIIDNPDLVRAVVNFAGGQSVVASVDVKKNFLGRYKIHVDCGKRSVSESCEEYISYVESLGVGEIFLNSIDNDGMMNGYDINLIKKVSSGTNLPVIACGGAGNLDDLKQAINIGGAHAVAAGSLFVYWGPRKAVLINYPKEEDLKEAGLY